MNISDRASTMRLDIRRRQEHLALLIWNQLKGTGSMLRGSIYARRRRCGKPRCRCLRGHLHRDRVLAIRRAGHLSVRGLDPAADVAVETAVAAWHGFRRQRGELAAACRALLRAVDRLAGLRQAQASDLR
jgi:hypothetical protein